MTSSPYRQSCQKHFKNALFQQSEIVRLRMAFCSFSVPIGLSCFKENWINLGKSNGKLFSSPFLIIISYKMTWKASTKITSLKTPLSRLLLLIFKSVESGLRTWAENTDHRRNYGSLHCFLKINFLFHNSHDKFERQIIVSNKLNRIMKKA